MAQRDVRFAVRREGVAEDGSHRIVESDAAFLVQTRHRRRRGDDLAEAREIKLRFLDADFLARVLVGAAPERARVQPSATAAADKAHGAGCHALAHGAPERRVQRRGGRRRHRCVRE